MNLETCLQMLIKEIPNLAFKNVGILNVVHKLSKR